MTIHESATVRNAVANARETTIGTAPLLRIYAGTVPANAAASIGAATLLVEMTLPSDWLAAASGGAKAKSGTWSGVAGATGTATFYRIWDSADTTCHRQGDIQADLTLDTTSIVSGRTVTIVSGSFTEGNA